MSEDSNPPYKSSYPELEMPKDGFKSTIPPHLLEGCGDHMQWLMQEISKNTQATEFACRAVIEQNRHLRALNGKTFKNEKNVAELEERVSHLNKQAKKLIPFLGPVAMFATLWQFAPFRWITYLSLFFVFTYLYPYYINHPLNLRWLFSIFFGQ